MRWLFVAYCFTVSIAGLQLFGLSGKTADYFAWTINPPMTAAFLGASYWGSLPMLVLASRATSWERSRISFFGVFVFSILTLGATIYHRDRFHFSDDTASAQMAAWTWLTVYIIVPVVALAAWFGQWREQRDATPGSSSPVPAWLRGTFAAQGAPLVVFGLALFLWPLDVAKYWPWALTPLTARAVAAWLVGMGIHALQAAFEGRFERVRPLMAACVLFVLLQFVVLMRFGESYSFGDTDTWVYVVFLGWVLATSGWGLVRGR